MSAGGCSYNMAVMAATPTVKVMSMRRNSPLNPFVRHQSSHSYFIDLQPLPVLYFVLLVESTDGDDEEVLPLCLQRGETGSQQGDQQ